jgi:hypothetical protein
VGERGVHVLPFEIYCRRRQAPHGERAIIGDLRMLPHTVAKLVRIRTARGNWSFRAPRRSAPALCLRRESPA